MKEDIEGGGGGGEEEEVGKEDGSIYHNLIKAIKKAKEYK